MGEATPAELSPEHPGRPAVRMRPEAEQRMRAGFQRRADQQAERYAVPLAHAEQLAVQLECGEVVGVFRAETGPGYGPGRM
jgi:hypothetical protein